MPLNKLEAMRAFVCVFEQGSFTAASRTLGTSVAAVTRTTARLEEELKTRLFHRTTRRVTPTDAGHDYYEGCIQILTDVERTEMSLQQANIAPRGNVRVVLPFSFGRTILAPELPAFCARYPEISLKLSFSDGPIDILESGFDVAVRLDDTADSSVIGRRLMGGCQVTAASPEYLRKHGTPQTPLDLKGHYCILGRSGKNWNFSFPDGRKRSVPVSGKLSVLNSDVLRECAIMGLGIIHPLRWLVWKDFERGALVPILPEYDYEGFGPSVIYPSKHHLTQKVRVVIDFLIEITQRVQNKSAHPAPYAMSKAAGPQPFGRPHPARGAARVRRILS